MCSASAPASCEGAVSKVVALWQAGLCRRSRPGQLGSAARSRALDNPDRKESTQHAARSPRPCARLLLRPGEAPRGSHLLPGPAPLSRSWVGNSSSSPSRLSAWPTTDFAARVELRRTQHGSCTQTPLKSSLSEQQVHPLTLLGFTLSGKSAFLEMLGDTAALDKKIVSTPRQSHVRGLFSSGCYRSREAEGDL
ncbi:uncharacterized protein LOC104858368 isoform X3 [Fukomys damarensis]|uniref:uncharacterized protein LOC104858368 isoform X3 n=1 Tax=Fukomys damarensis TaxID=885580 RepID=UPI00053FF85E|nr:uncharacterized protein LOC104858368 isoform X3 [Fukomys damarensis]